MKDMIEIFEDFEAKSTGNIKRAFKEFSLSTWQIWKHGYFAGENKELERRKNLKGNVLKRKRGENESKI